ncbi:hypothetical protein APB26_34330 [Pseudomonas aeruginosa]|nr:hypothetical protein APB26_34330 [Pseudomonas aeruginosa]RPV61304.1 hypothetical protein IPC838_18465 [Pseudomonas aeruginosa]
MREYTAADSSQPAIGLTYRCWDGHTYLCESWEEMRGYWMVRTDAPPGRRQDLPSMFRRNVSERAIGRTFHLVPHASA